MGATFGEPEEQHVMVHVVLHKALIHAATWVLNLAIAEWVIRRHPSRWARSAAPTPRAREGAIPFRPPVVCMVEGSGRAHLARQGLRQLSEHTA